MDLLWEWLTMLVRWWHLVAGITWVGASFYFNWFDSLVRPSTTPTLRENNRGVLNEVHGGNFYYHEQYYPDHLPAGLHAHAWPSKMTFITGLMLLVMVYWMAASTYMIDKQVADIAPWLAIAISAGSIVLCWWIYDRVCKWTLDNRVVLAVMSVVTVAAAFGFQHCFGGRAAYISVGVMLGSMMGLNVWRVIAPKSIHMQQQLRSGAGYHHEDGEQAKRRSQHNNYFTLPVVLTMVSNHFASAYSHAYAWVILVCLMAAAWGVRHALNVWYKKHQRPWWLYALIALTSIAAIGVNSLSISSPPPPAQAAQGLNEVQLMALMTARCTGCHSQHPTLAGFTAAPLGVMLDTPEQVKTHAARVLQRAVTLRDMPLGNITHMTPEERSQLKITLDRMAGK